MIVLKVEVAVIILLIMMGNSSTSSSNSVMVVVTTLVAIACLNGRRNENGSVMLLAIRSPAQ